MTRKQNGISWWMVALNGVILAILAFKTWACLADPSLLFGQAVAYDPAHVGALRELAGRNLAMIALGLLAWLRPSPAAYLSVFAVAFVRETSDMGIAHRRPAPDVRRALRTLDPCLLNFAAAAPTGWGPVRDRGVPAPLLRDVNGARVMVGPHLEF